MFSLVTVYLKFNFGGGGGGRGLQLLILGVCEILCPSNFSLFLFGLLLYSSRSHVPLIVLCGFCKPIFSIKVYEN